MTSNAYELLLRFPDGHEELQLTDHLERFRRSRDLLVIRDRYWRVVATTEASQPAIAGRLVCISLDAALNDPDTTRAAESARAAAA